jgi:GNAT superfamily N-acetyltransferase
MSAFTLRRLTSPTAHELEALTDVLLDCVEGGASVSFMLPLSRAKARAFWQHVADGVAAGDRALLVAADDRGTIVGTVQLVLAQPDNQPHRADVAKLLVHRSARGHGLGDALMQGVEPLALAAGKTLLVLDTASAAAEKIYARQGWQRLGSIPGYALLPQGGLCDTVVFFKALRDRCTRSLRGARW